MPKPTGSYFGQYVGSRSRKKYQATGEFRPPRRGEFYLSGSIVTAYRAANDLGTAYWIAVDSDAPSWEKYPAKEWALALQGLTPSGSEFVTPAECVAYVQRAMHRDLPTIVVRLREQNKTLRDTLRTMLDALAECEGISMDWKYFVDARKILENKDV